jgi:hypothetical protein
MPIGLGQIVELVPGHVHASGSDLVQKRLPEVGAGFLDERDIRLSATPEPIAQARYQF